MTTEADLSLLPTEDDLPYEEEILKNPYSVKSWLRYIGLKKDAPRKARNLLFERALKELPGSYKIWKMYLTLRLQFVKNLVINDPEWQFLNNCFERSLVFLHKMPRIWVMFLENLMNQKLVTATRRSFDRALRALPVTQHDRIWPLYLKFVDQVKIPEMSVRVYRRYLKLYPDKIESYIEHLKSVGHLDEASVQLAKVINDDSHHSQFGKSKHQLWLELCDIISKNPEKIKSMSVEPIIRNGIKQFTDEVGNLWCALADYYIRAVHFEKARDVFEEGIQTVMTVKDFSQIFDAYSQFEESMIQAKFEVAKSTPATEEDVQELDVDLELRMARLEVLVNERRPLLLNSVLLRQNPHNVHEWQKRANIYKDRSDLEMVVKTYTKALQTIDPFKATGRVHTLWINFAKFYEEEGDVDNARKIFEKSVTARMKTVDGLASIWCCYAEMEIRHKKPKRALELMQRATSTPGRKDVDYYDENLSPGERLFKSTKLWSFYVDLEESLGTLESTRGVYDRIIELRVATPQMIINYAQLMEENKYFEESWKVFEKGVALFKYPHVLDIWKTYLTKFVERYKGTKLERARDLFEQALEKAPARDCKNLFLMYAKLEEHHGLSKRAMAVYDRAITKVAQPDKLAMFKTYIAKAAEIFGVTYTRSIYEKAISSLDDIGAREMAIKYAELERTLGEIDRARVLYIHASQFCPPSRDKEFWDMWQDFEKKHGNEDTFREMLRIRRSVQAQFQTAASFMSQDVVAAEAQAAGGSMAALERQAEEAKAANKPAGIPGKVSFVSSSTAPAAAPANPEEINLDEDDAAESAGEEEDGAADNGPAPMEEERELEERAIPASVVPEELRARAAAAAEKTEKLGALERLKRAKQ